MAQPGTEEASVVLSEKPHSQSTTFWVVVFVGAVVTASSLMLWG